MTRHNRGEHNKDPWSGKNKNQGPPELDKILGDMARKLQRIIFHKGTSGENKAPGHITEKNILFLIGVFIAVIAFIWVLAGFYVVKPTEKALILRFGKYHGESGFGWHWNPKFIDTYYIVNMRGTFANKNKFGKQPGILTKDAQLVKVPLLVHYKIINPEKYLFAYVDVKQTLRQIVHNVLQQIVSEKTLNDLMVDKGAIDHAGFMQILKEMIQKYEMGLEVTGIELSGIEFSEELNDIFKKGLDERKEQQQAIAQEQAYAENAISLANIQRERLLEEAQTYKEKVVLRAKANIERFSAALSAYKKSPQATSDRIYFNTMEAIFKNNDKIFLTTNSAKNSIYLPLDKLNSEQNKEYVPTIKPTSNNNEESTQYSSQEIKRSPRFLLNRASYTGRGGNRHDD